MIFFHDLTYKIRFMSLNIWDQEAIMVKNTSNKENRMGTPLGTGSCCPKKIQLPKVRLLQQFL